MSERTVFVVVGVGPDAYRALDEAGKVAMVADFVESVAIVRCSDATAEALLDSLEDEAVT